MASEFSILAETHWATGRAAYAQNSSQQDPTRAKTRAARHDSLPPQVPLRTRPGNLQPTTPGLRLGASRSGAPMNRRHDLKSRSADLADHVAAFPLRRSGSREAWGSANYHSAVQTVVDLSLSSPNRHARQSSATVAGRPATQFAVSCSAAR